MLTSNTKDLETISPRSEGAAGAAAPRPRCRTGLRPPGAVSARAGAERGAQGGAAHTDWSARVSRVPDFLCKYMLTTCSLTGRLLQRMHVPASGEL